MAAQFIIICPYKLYKLGYHLDVPITYVDLNSDEVAETKDIHKIPFKLVQIGYNTDTELSTILSLSLFTP